MPRKYDNKVAGRHTLRFAERVVIYEELKKVCRKEGETGYCIYEDGWDDDRVVAVLGNVALVNVQSIRREIFGNLRAYTIEKVGAKPDDLVLEVLDRLLKVEDRLVALERMTKAMAPSSMQLSPPEPIIPNFKETRHPTPLPKNLNSSLPYNPKNRSGH